MTVPTNETLLVVDGHSLAFRAFFALPVDNFSTSSGQATNAVWGFATMLAQVIDAEKPDHLGVAFDVKGGTFRNEMLPQYKGTREAAPEELLTQLPLIQRMLTALGVTYIEKPGFEGDDVIATLATRSTWPVDVVTGDRDLFQLVDDDRAVRVLYVGRGVAKHEQITDSWLQAKYTITGAGYVDFAVMRGDPSDGLPGVKGIGEKTAAQLIGKYGDLDGIVANAANLSSGVQRSLAAAVDYLGPAREVVTAARGVPLPEVDLALPAAPKDPELFAALTEELNLGGSADRILAALAAAGGRVS